LGVDVIKNNKKAEFWIYFITILIGNNIADNVNNYLGLKGTDFFSMRFAERIGITMLCYIPVYFLVSGIRYIWEKKKSDKLILIIMITFAVISIILSAISMIIPNFLYVYPIVFICLGLVNLLNGVKQLKGANKTTGKLLIVLSILIFSFGLKELVSQGYLVFDIF
jgi:hypothetical protein